MAFTTSNPYMRPMRAVPKKPTVRSPLRRPRQIYGGLGQIGGGQAGGGSNAAEGQQIALGAMRYKPPRVPADPSDAQYISDLGQIEARFQRGSADITAEGKLDALSHQRALAMMAERHPEDLQNAKEAANRQGLFYSGHLGKQLGDIELDYARRRQAEDEGFDARQIGRTNAADELERLFGGSGTERVAAMQSAIERALLRDQEFGVPADPVAQLPSGPLPNVFGQQQPRKKKRRPAYDDTIFGSSPIFQLRPRRGF